MHLTHEPLSSRRKEAHYVSSQGIWGLFPVRSATGPRSQQPRMHGRRLSTLNDFPTPVPAARRGVARSVWIAASPHQETPLRSLRGGSV